MYQIKNDVPPPTSRSKSKFCIFLSEMNVGDYADVDWKDYQSAHSYAKCAGIKVSCRSENDVHRVWRIK